MEDTNFLKGKRILVTGGTGSIGREIVKQCLERDAALVRVFSRNFAAQKQLRAELWPYEDRLETYSGTITEESSIERGLQGIDIVFHAAANKYVDDCENDPLNAIRVNVDGTENVLEAAMEANHIEKLIIVSTDKAVLSATIMGATKMMTERMAVKNMERLKQEGGDKAKPIISVVRFGNVAGSTGSVIPIFTQQIRHGGPVTVTHPRMARFIMTIPQAVELVFLAAADAQGGEIYVLKMKSLRIVDLARVLIKQVSEKYDIDASTIETKYIGLSQYEKLHEHLVTPEELMRTIDMGQMYKVIPYNLAKLPEYKAAIEANDLFAKINPEPEDYNGISSESVPQMSDDEIADLIEQLS